MIKKIQHVWSSKSLTILFLAFCVLSFGLNTKADFSLSDWQYSRVINNPSSIAGMVKVVLPNDISWTTKDFSELRVIDANNAEVPFVLTRNITPPTSSVSANILNVGTDSDGSTKFIVDTLKSGIVRTNLDFIISNPDFRRQVTIYSSDTLLSINDSRWSRINNSGYIFSFTDPSTGSKQGKSSVGFEANTSRYFKVVISGGQEGSLVINGAKVFDNTEISLSSYTQELPATIFNNPKNKTTEVLIDRGVSGLLSNSINLFSKDSNYVRKVIIEGSDTSSTDGSGWNYIGESSISSVSTPLFQGYKNEVDFSEQTYRYIRISIVNDDNPPLVLDPKVKISGPSLEVIFDSKPNNTYRIFYGNSGARMPQYDISRFASYIQTSNLPTFFVGQQVSNSSYIAPKPPVVPFTESNKYLLNTLLVLVVIVIGAAVILYLRKYLSLKSKIESKETWSGEQQGDSQNQ